MKRLFVTLVIASAAAAANAAPLPDLDFREHCSKNLFESICLSVEATSHRNLLRLWPKLSEKNQEYCAHGATNYSDLESCAKIKSNAPD